MTQPIITAAFPGATSSSLYTPEHYQNQLTQKMAKFDADFVEFDLPTPLLFVSPEKNFRMRAEFRIWHKGPVSTYCMFSNDELKRPYDLIEFPIGSELMNDLMPKLLNQINLHELLRTKLYQIDFLTTRSGEALVSFIYHKKLDEEWLVLANSIETMLGIRIVGRSKNQKIVVSQDFVIETMPVNGRTYSYQQIESGFTQPNGFVCEAMLNWAVEHSKGFGKDLLELYCGNGNFTLPLAQNFRRVLATEISKPSTQSAQFNIALNKIENIDLARISSDEFTQAMNKVRAFNRLQHIDLDSYQFSTIFVDPPRSGLDENTLKLTQAFENIIYISCNPNTLRENLRELTKTHKITQAALFDQFPYTDHLEVGVILKRR